MNKFCLLALFLYAVMSSHLFVGEIKPRNINIKINSTTRVNNSPSGTVTVSNSPRTATYIEEFSFNANEYNGKIQPRKNYIIHAKCLLQTLNKSIKQQQGNKAYNCNILNVREG